MRKLDKRGSDKKVTSKRFFRVLILTLLAIMIAIIRFITRWNSLKETLPIKESEKFETIKDTGEINQTEEEAASYTITHNQETPPLAMGVQRFHYIYSVALPQTYLTLLSVLQGLVFGVLLYTLPLPHDLSLKAFFSFLLQYYFYLPYITSSLVILIIWNQFVHGILFLTWPFTVFQSALIFLISLTEILTFTHANVLPAWLFGLGWIAIIGALIRFNNIRYLPNDKETWVAIENYASFSKEHEITDGIYYMSLGIIVLILSLIFNDLIGIAKDRNNLLPAIIMWTINSVVFIMAISILFIDRINRQKYLNLFVSGSDLTVSSHGVVSYKKDTERKK